MAVKEIIKMGNPLLRRRAEPVADASAPEVIELVQDLIDTMEAADGAGLAAPQIAIPLRVVVFHAPPENPPPSEPEDSSAGDPGNPREDEPGDATEGDDEWRQRPGADTLREHPPTVLINPEIEFLSDESELGWEGCLSLPGLVGLVPRFTRIRYSGISLAGRLIQREATGFHARVVQHECDHLDGCLYPQRMTDLSMLLFESEIGHYQEEKDRDPPV